MIIRGTSIDIELLRMKVEPLRRKDPAEMALNLLCPRGNFHSLIINE